mgnify:CR=1 FL=1
MSDKTVPADAEDYKDDEQNEKVNTTHVDRDPLVKEAESDEGETPNRDEDEFSKRHLKEPEIDPEVQEDNAPDDPPRGEEGDPDDVTPPIDPDGANN